MNAIAANRRTTLAFFDAVGRQDQTLLQSLLDPDVAWNVPRVSGHRLQPDIFHADQLNCATVID